MENNKHVERVKGLCPARGCVLRPYGKAWRITGLRVDVLVADLGDVGERDLAPVKDAARRKRDGVYAFEPRDAGGGGGKALRMAVLV